jgi:hypothetical protein
MRLEDSRKKWTQAVESWRHPREGRADMRKRHDLERHLQSLREVREIMNAMKNLALVETHKLVRLLATQRRVVASIQSIATVFLSFHRTC